jgi:hypothetical protein
MSATEPGKTVENYFPKAPIDIKINDLAQELTPLCIIKFQKYIQHCTINIPIKGNTLGLLGALINDTNYKTINNNVSWTPLTTPGSMLGFSLEILRMRILAFIHRDQFNFPNDLLQKIGLPCHKIDTFTLVRLSQIFNFVVCCF